MRWYTKVIIASKAHVQQLEHSLLKEKKEALRQQLQLQGYGQQDIEAELQKLNRTPIDPFMRYFVMKYDKIVPWRMIKSAGDLKNYLTNEMLPKLKKASFDTEAENSSFFVKDIDVERAWRADPANRIYSKAYSLHKSGKEKEAKDLAIAEVNKQKQLSYRQWLDHSAKWNDNPWFQYSLLDTMLSTSPNTSYSSAIPVESDIIQDIHDKIKGGDTEFGMMATYWKLSNQGTKKVAFTTGQDGWALIPSSKKSQENETTYGLYSQNLKALQRYGRDAGWCVGQEYHSNAYLSLGDFYILTEKNRAVIAIRIGESGNIAPDWSKYFRICNYFSSCGRSDYCCCCCVETKDSGFL